MAPTSPKPPPPPLPPATFQLEHDASNMPVAWKNFTTRLQIYMIANGLNEEPDERKVAILLNCIGAEALQVYYSFDVDMKTITYKDLLQKFEAYYLPKVNISVERHKLFNRRQGDDEELETYATDLKNISLQYKPTSFDDAVTKAKTMRDSKLHTREISQKEDVNAIRREPKPRSRPVLRQPRFGGQGRYQDNGQGQATQHSGQVCGLRWKVHRRLLTPAFHFNILQNFFQVFLKNDKILVKTLRATGKGTNISLFPIIALNALDNVTESIMGVSVNAQNNTESEYIKALGKMNDVLATRIRDVFASQDALFNLMPIKKIHDSALQVLHKSSRDVIATRRKELEKNNITQLNIENDHAEISYLLLYDWVSQSSNDPMNPGIKNRHAFLDLLLLAEVDGQRIDDEHIREEVDTFMFEGHDTTTTGIVFTLYCLSKFRDTQEKVFEEQKAIFGGDFNRDPTFSEMQKMKYLDLVIKESMRMFSPVPGIQRFITEDTELAGVRVPKNTTCLVNIYSLHRNPKVWENPMEFRPERFENPLKDPFAFLAFSAGARNCMGQKFAMLEMKTTISAIVRNFKILPSDLPDPNVGMVLVLRSQNGVHIKLEER
ncbi:cytochrome p450 domain-containing protein [Phthorimaea operculella]|nr:cytochrome p450 domain-containing protein [Phthorimaea operculella]